MSKQLLNLSKKSMMQNSRMSTMRISTISRHFSSASSPNGSPLSQFESLAKDTLGKVQQNLGTVQEQVKKMSSNVNVPNMPNGLPNNVAGVSMSDVTNQFEEKINDLKQLNLNNLTPESVTNKSVEQLSGLIHALILLSRSNLVTDKELDEKLGKLLPKQVVDVVKEQAKMMPMDPYMTKLEGIEKKLEELENKISGNSTTASGSGKETSKVAKETTKEKK